jgi:hypothetical protein
LNGNGTLTITASTFSGNSAPYGGGIWNGGTLTITDSSFRGNSAPGAGAAGGGILNGGRLTITDSSFSGNHALDGGGVQNGPNGSAVVTNSTFSGNSANQYGGGGISNVGMLTVIGSTFSGNSAKGFGGAVVNGNTTNQYLIPGILQIRNTLLAGNSARSGGSNIYNVAGSKIKSLGHNLIGDGDGGSGYAATDLVGTAANPIDPMLGPLQYNGGPTWTMALLPGSPAIGAGGPSDSEWDQRGPGYARTVNGMTDIGAYEAQPTGAQHRDQPQRP